MCIKESLRLYPPVPYIAKELSEDFFVEGNRIPKGVVISRVYQGANMHKVYMSL